MLKEFFVGIRPKTLAAAIMPPVTAGAFVYYEFQIINLFMLICCLGLALFLQMATNFYNDGLDFIKGADSDRDGPKRITSDENIKLVFLFGHFCLIAAFFFGVPLILKGGWIFAVFGFVSMFLAYGYTGGPFPLAYLGLGELFVFLFFGLLATVGSAFLISGNLQYEYFLVGCITGLLSTVLIMINNYRDASKDILVGKKTLATRISKTRYLQLIDFCLFGPYLIILYLFIFVDLKFVFPILAAGLAHRIRFNLREASQMETLNYTLGMAGKHLVLFCLLFTLSCLVP